MIGGSHVLALVLSLLGSVVAAQENCRSEYERGKRESGAWGEKLGIVEGTIYGYSLQQSAKSYCLKGNPQQQVEAIANALNSSAFASAPVLMDDVPSKAQATTFLVRFFPCGGK